MRRLLAGLALATLIATPVAAQGGASITASDGPFSFGQSVSTEAVVAAWAGKRGRQPDMGYWAKAECFASGNLVYAQFADLTPPVVQSGFTFGPTPSWSGGPASCRVVLLGMDDGAFGRELAEDTFDVGG